MPIKKSLTVNARGNARELAAFLKNNQGASLDETAIGLRWTKSQVRTTLNDARDCGWAIRCRHKQRENTYWLLTRDEEIVEFFDEWLARVSTSVARVFLIGRRRSNPSLELQAANSLMLGYITLVRQSALDRAKDNLAALD